MPSGVPEFRIKHISNRSGKHKNEMMHDLDVNSSLSRAGAGYVEATMRLVQQRSAFDDIIQKQIQNEDIRQVEADDNIQHGPILATNVGGFEEIEKQE